MADIQLHTHTQDIEITAPQTKDVVIGSPMDKGGVLPITKNGKYVVSGYDLAEVEVYIPPFVNYLTQPVLQETLSINCETTEELDLRGMDIAKITQLRFNNPHKQSIVTLIDLTGWNFSNVKDIRDLFIWCTKLNTIRGIEYVVHSGLKYGVSSLFCYCYELTDIGDTSKWDFSNISNVASLFYQCKKLSIIDGSTWDWTLISDSIQNTFTSGDRNIWKSWIGNHTLEEVERGDVVCFRGLGTNIARIQTGAWDNRMLRYSSLLALCNGMADRIEMGQAGSLEISKDLFNKNMPNDDDTLPAADVLAERQSTIRAICARKNYNLVLS